MLTAVLSRTGLSPKLYREAERRAEALSTDAGRELVAAQLVEEEELARAIAEVVGIPFGRPGAGDRPLERRGGGARHLRTCTINLEPRLFIAPPLETLDETARWIDRWGDGKIVVTTAPSLRAHIAGHSSTQRLHDARYGLPATRPDWSARSVLNARQGYVLGIATILIALALVLVGGTLWRVFHILLAGLFACCTLFRFLVLMRSGAERRRIAEERARRDDALRLPLESLPVYTVLVALYHERDMVPDLVAALGRLNWPASCLDVKLICEGDDVDTISAVRAAIAGRAGFELVEVPPSLPRTKPKALNHALPLARGDYVVLYDAEDRPDPDQLLDAWLAFRSAGQDLACVQAPLVIRNGANGWLPALFAIEYAVLFRALLPFLARRRLPIPLGGTSNHFRRPALNRVGGWDSHNVAEDADLGIRLARHGYRTDMISSPTSEIAPERWRDWRNQRSRWVKGWIQTYLVHMRRPGVAFRELGFVSMMAFQILFISMVAGAVMHTAFVIYLAVAAITALAGGVAAIAPPWLIALDIANVVAATLVFSLLAARTLAASERGLMRRLWGLWIYWLLVSVASVRSVVQLIVDPHRWDKTPHREEPPSP